MPSLVGVGDALPFFPVFLVCFVVFLFVFFDFTVAVVVLRREVCATICEVEQKTLSNKEKRILYIT